MDLSALTAVLNGLGPYGILIGIGLMLLKDKLGLKLPSLPTPTPKPDPVPGPKPEPLPDNPLLPNNPVLDALLRLLLSLRAKGLAEQEKIVSTLVDAELTKK